MQGANALLKIDTLSQKLSTLKKLCGSTITKELSAKSDQFEKILKIAKKHIKVHS